VEENNRLPFVHELTDVRVCIVISSYRGWFERAVIDAFTVDSNNFLGISRFDTYKLASSEEQPLFALAQSTVIACSGVVVIPCIAMESHQYYRKQAFGHLPKINNNFGPTSVRDKNIFSPGW